MTIKTVTYSQSKETMYGYGLKRWDKAGVEISMDENDNPENAFSMAKQLVDEQLSKIIHQEDEMKGTHVRDVVDNPEKLSLKDQLLRDMKQCKSLKTLKLYEPQAEKDAEFKLIYDEKFMELSKKHVS